MNLNLQNDEEIKTTSINSDNNSKNKAEVIKSLKPLFDMAKEKKLFFRSVYRNTIMSPRQLQQAQSDGNCLWPASHWSLIDPKEYISGLQAEVKEKLAIIRDYTGGSL